MMHLKNKNKLQPQNDYVSIFEQILSPSFFSAWFLSRHQLRHANTYIIQLTPVYRGFSVADYIKYLSYLLSLTIYIYSFFRIIFLTINLIHPVNFSFGRKPEHPEKTHDFR